MIAMHQALRRKHYAGSVHLAARLGAQPQRIMAPTVCLRCTVRIRYVGAGISCCSLFYEQLLIRRIVRSGIWLATLALGVAAQVDAFC